MNKLIKKGFIIKKILLSGGSGFLGSNLVQYLLERKYVVHVVDIAFNKEFDKYKDNEYFYFHLTDITDESEINKLKSFSDQKIMIDVLINNAAINQTLISHQKISQDLRIFQF